MLNKDNCISWSSRLLRYAKSKPNGKLVVNSIKNGPYTNDELIKKEVKQMEADDQAIQKILIGLPEDIYTVVDTCDTTQEIWLRVEQMMKGIQNVGNQNGLTVVRGIANLNVNPNENGNVIAAQAEGNGNGKNEQHPANVEKTHAYFESLYNNLAIEVEKVNTVNRKMKETNAHLTTKLARYRGQEESFEINKAKFNELETGYRKFVYQEQRLTKKINALHLSFAKQITALNEEIINLNNQAKSREEVYFTNTSTTTSVSNTVSKPITIPDDEFLDDTPSVDQKFLNEVKDTIVTLQSVIKHRMNENITNWSSLVYQEFHKIIKDEIAPIVNKV
nr:hypothetical protein [Tanacetum cinerariifolium]